ncbi:MAG TPA: 8-oxo-dGTP diphosphatase MutT [Desulfobacteraceae bacterium]|nr:8-oxo-dGTP diphosphatase MutT [Desulfobacteraceae bacterium]
MIDDRGLCDQVHVTAGIIRNGPMILIARRPPGKHLEGFWEFPGGKQEAGETLRECLVREIREELDILVKPLALVMTSAYEYPQRRVVLYFFDCMQVSGSPRPVQGQELRWVKPSELMDLEFPPPDRALVERLIRNPDVDRSESSMPL